MSQLKVWKWLAADQLKKRALPLLAHLAQTGSLIERLVSKRAYMHYLMASQRLAPDSTKAASIRRIIRGRMVDFRSFLPDNISVERAAGRMIVLAPPRREGSELRHGVLLIKFTETLRFFAHHVNIERLQRHFRVVIEPSWAGYALPEILFLADAPDSILVEAAEITDREFVRALDSSLVSVPMGSGDWVDHRVFRPLELERDYNAVCVANYTPVKRLHVFFRAIREISQKRQGFRAALVCSTWGAGREVVIRMLDHYGVSRLVDIHEDLSHLELNNILNRARCNVLFSLKEGSNRSLFEGMFAGVPGILLAENVGVNKDHFRRETGLVVQERHVAEGIINVSDNFRTFSPRKWAMENISPEASTRKLADLLGRLFPETAPPELLVKTNIPEAAYFRHDLRPNQLAINRKLLPLFFEDSPEPGPQAVLQCVSPLSEANRGTLA